MSTVFTSTIAHTLKKTLRDISRDESNAETVYDKWLKVGSMDEAYVDDMETAGPGLFAEKTEGEEIQADTIREGPITRYLARTFAKKLLITEEAVEDCKYKEVFDAARMLKRAGNTTVEFDATNILARGFNSSYVGGDNQPLFSNAHPLVNGGTQSNIMATPMSPSVAALTTAISQIMMWVGHDGFPQTDIEPEMVVFPTPQWGAWSSVLNSEKNPVAGNFAEINVVRRQFPGIKAVRNPYWTSTTTNWAVITNVSDGLQFLWRRKWRTRTWVHNDNEVMVTARSGRWARGWTNWRGALGVNL